MHDPLRILVLGYIVRSPLGGLAWHYLNYVLGLKQLGHEVFFVEDSGDEPSCYDPTRHVVDEDPTYGLEWTDRVFSRLGLERSWGYFDAFTGSWRGPHGEGMRAICESADLLLNISGIVPMRPWYRKVPHRAFVDTDPVFEQVRQLTEEERRAHTEAHTAHFTFGENIAEGTADAPDDGISWNATRQPVCLEAWPRTSPPEGGSFTTVMQWESYPSREYEGTWYGQKKDSFGPYLELPRRIEAELELALGSESAPREELRTYGWSIEDPLEVTEDPWTYQAYIRGSKAEFGVAKHGYVIGNSGWFSERSACYLASGRPVLVQDTGFIEWMDTGRGVIAFSDPDEARAGIEEITQNYDVHVRAARETAEQYFDARTVLPELLRRVISD